MVGWTIACGWILLGLAAEAIIAQILLAVCSRQEFLRANMRLCSPPSMLFKDCQSMSSVIRDNYMASAISCVREIGVLG